MLGNGWWLPIIGIILIMPFNLFFLFGSSNIGLLLTELCLVTFVVTVGIIKSYNYQKLNKKFLAISCYLIVGLSVSRALFIFSTFFETMYQLSEFFLLLIKFFLLIPGIILVLSILERDEKWQEKFSVVLFSTLLALNGFFIILLEIA
jgi:hypothetical protein